jgi:hypothetical protein
MTKTTKLKKTTKKTKSVPITKNKYYLLSKKYFHKIIESKVYYYIMLILFFAVTAKSVVTLSSDIEKVFVELRKIIPNDQQFTLFEKIKILAIKVNTDLVLTLCYETVIR